MPKCIALQHRPLPGINAIKYFGRGKEMCPAYQIIESWDLEYCSICVRLKARKARFKGPWILSKRNGVEGLVDMPGSRICSQAANALRALFIS